MPSFPDSTYSTQAAKMASPERAAAPSPRRPLLPFFPLLLGLGAVLILTLIVAVALGPVTIPFAEVWHIILEHLAGKLGFSAKMTGDTPQAASAAADRIILQIRLPRVLLGALVGAGLSVVGATLQTTTQNKLADPYLFGISAGATAGAVVILLYSGAVFGPASLALGAFIGACLSSLMVISIARRDGDLSSERLILAGLAISFVVMSIANLLLFMADHRAASAVLFWMLGGLGAANWDNLPLPAIGLGLGLGYLLLQARALNALLAGNETALTLGIDVGRLRLQLFAVSSAITALMVSVSGSIGFVGLMLPHLVRACVGADHRRLLPVAALGGAIFVVWVDVAARLILAPEDLPIGIVTAGIGGLFFIWLMRRR
jgi:iron complex transport system permease protein